MAVQISAVPLAPLVAGIMLNLSPKRGDVACALAFGGFMSVVVGMVLFGHFYYRCPVCSHSLTRGPKYIKKGEFYKGHCNQCGADFKAGSVAS